LPQPPQWLAFVAGSTQAPPQLSWPAEQHRPAMQEPPGQSASAQQRELATHAPLHSLKPGLHWKPHAPPAQVEVALATAGQAVQLVPHEFTLESEEQRPPQSCVPVAHVPMHAAAASMQTLAQSFWLVGQRAPHIVPSHVAEPPCGGAHAEHDVPHEAVDALRAQLPLQTW
jgi:hypothetical protein